VRLKVDHLVGKPKNNSVAVATRVNPLKSDVGYIVLLMPPYDCFALPDSIASPEGPLRSIGAVRIFRRPATLLRYGRRAGAPGDRQSTVTKSSGKDGSVGALAEAQTTDTHR
jgi:hypothetical protein